MKKQHTSGEWKVKKPYWTYYVVSGETTIAQLQIIDEDEANARLIAAAPELLNACLWAKEQFKILSDKGLYPEHLLQENGGNGFTILTNAIQKAT